MNYLARGFYSNTRLQQSVEAANDSEKPFPGPHHSGGSTNTPRFSKADLRVESPLEVVILQLVHENIRSLLNVCS